MSELPAKLPLREIQVGAVAVHEAGHTLAALARRARFNLAYLREDGGGRVHILAADPWSELLITAAGNSAMRQIPPFVRNVPAEATPVITGVESGVERLDRINSFLRSEGVEDLAWDNGGLSDEDKFNECLEKLIGAGRIRRNYGARWWGRAQARMDRFCWRHRCALRQVALALEIRRALNREEVVAILEGMNYEVPLSVSPAVNEARSSHRRRLGDAG